MKKSKFYQIKNITEREYTLVDCDGSVITRQIQDVDKSASAFTIQDAKDGDVLCYKDEISLYKYDIKNCTKLGTTFGGFVYHCCYDGKEFITDSLYSLTEQDKMDIHPATKSQRDILFEKMKGAGCTFDFEKNELKKIEEPKLTVFEEEVKDMMDDYRDAIDENDATVEEVKERAAYLLSLIPQKPAEWSEEDKKMFVNIKACLRNANEDYSREVDWLKSIKPQPKNEWSEEDEKMIGRVRGIIEAYAFSQSAVDVNGDLCEKKFIDVDIWLKSFKDRYTWKPSDEQMHAFEQVYDWYNNNFAPSETLTSLYKDLEKLKGE